MHCKYKTGNPINDFPIRSLAHPAEPIFALTLQQPAVSHTFFLCSEDDDGDDGRRFISFSNNRIHRVILWHPPSAKTSQASPPRMPHGQTGPWSTEMMLPKWLVKPMNGSVALTHWSIPFSSGMKSRHCATCSNDWDDDVRVAICSVYNMYTFDWNSRMTFNSEAVAEKEELAQPHSYWDIWETKPSRQTSPSHASKHGEMRRMSLPRWHASLQFLLVQLLEVSQQ